MLDMSRWEELVVDVMDDLHLDPQNVRLGTDVNAPEADIMADLFRNEKALDLVESIVRVGYLTHEVPIVLRRRRKLIVAEGNRRVAALKAIQNPYLVPEFQARVAALVAELPSREHLRRIHVKRAPSQTEADQLIAALHTGDTRVRWSPARQAAFFEAQIQQGKTLGQLRSQYPTIEVEKYVLRSGILGLFRSVAYSNPAYSDLLSSRGSSTSTLARIYESKPFIALTGLGMDDRGSVVLGISDDTFAQMAELIVAGIAEGSINTRTIGTTSSPRFKKLMDDLEAIVESGTAGTGTTTSDQGMPPANRAEQQEPAEGQTPPRGAGTATGAAPARSGGTGSAGSPTKADDRRPAGQSKPASATRVSACLDIGQLRVPDTFPDAVRVLLEELSAINVNRFPNATFDLMRSFLEKSIKAKAEARGVDLKRSGHDGYVYLKNCLQWLQEDVEANGPKHLVQVLKRMQSGKVLDFVGSSDFLNALNHNHHVSVTPAEVRQSWGQMKSVLAVVLT